MLVWPYLIGADGSLWGGLPHKKDRLYVKPIEAVNTLQSIFEHKYHKLVAVAADVLGANCDEANDIVHDTYIELAENGEPVTEAVITTRVVWRAKDELRRRQRQARPESCLDADDQRDFHKTCYGDGYE